MRLFRRAWRTIRFPQSLAELVLYLSLPLIFLFLALVRPPTPFYAMLLAPIALAAMLFEFTGGTLVALVAMAGVAVLIALDPDVARRGMTLQEAWPILSMYLVVGLVVGWLATRERERERRLVSAARRLHVVQEIAQAITTSLDLERTLQTIIAETHRLVPFERAAVVLRENDLLRVVAVSDSFRQPATVIGQLFSLKESASGWAIQQRRVWSGGVTAVSQYPDTQLLCPPMASCLIIPLQFQGKVIGVFILGGQGLADPSTPDIDNLNQIVDQMAIAIEHARLFEAERRWSRRMAAISDACREISASLDLERTLSLVMDKGVETLPMDAGALFMVDPESQAYRVAVSHNLSPGHIAQITFAFEQGVPGWVVKHRQALIIPDAASDVRVHPYVLQEGVKSVLATPLVAREQIVGVFNLYSKTKTNAFDDEAMRLAGVFAAQAAIAIENARLVEELRRAAVELEARVERRTRQLRQTQAQIIQAEKMAVVGRLASSVAHEVNNPLQAIALQLQLVVDDGVADPVGRRLAIIQEELARIAGIVQRLLDFQRPTPGKRAPQNISALLDNVLSLAGKQLEQQNVTVIREEHADLKPILVVANQIKQVFLNLVLNAIEAMPEGGQLHICTQQSDDMLTIAFTDTGIGMPAEVMHQIFEPFFSTKTTGTGLGLAVSHEIISQHGGQLEASSRPGQGSTFTVRLPLYEQQEP